MPVYSIARPYIYTHTRIRVYTGRCAAKTAMISAPPTDARGPSFRNWPRAARVHCVRTHASEYDPCRSHDTERTCRNATGVSRVTRRKPTRRRRTAVFSKLAFRFSASVFFFFLRDDENSTRPKPVYAPQTAVRGPLGFRFENVKNIGSTGYLLRLEPRDTVSSDASSSPAKPQIRNARLGVRFPVRSAP